MAAAVSSFNKGSKALSLVMEEMNMESNEVINAHLAVESIQQFRGSESSKLKHTKKQVEKHLKHSAQLRCEGPTHGPGIDWAEF